MKTNKLHCKLCLKFKASKFASAILLTKINMNNFTYDIK